MRKIIAILLLTPLLSFASDRKDIMDAIRPLASQKVNQPVLIKVDKLNIDKSSAMLIGELKGSDGKSLNWTKIDVCSMDLDKMLWVVLEKKEKWTVKHMEICASEPPYWYLEDYGGFDKNCGIYKGIEMENNKTLEQLCINKSKGLGK